MCSEKRGTKDWTQATNTEEVGSVLGKGDGKVWSERQKKNQKRLSQKPKDIFQNLKCLTQVKNEMESGFSNDVTGI